MSRSHIALLVAVLATSLPAGAGAGDAAVPALDTALSRALVAPGIAPGRTAAVAVDLRTGATVYSANAERALLPASVEKLPVTLAALRLLTPSYRFHTVVVGDGERVERRWEGNLDLVGHGDPTLAPSDLEALARDIAASGIRRVTGRVVGDESYFDARRDAPGWKPSYLGVESRPLSALSVEGATFAGMNGSAKAAARAFTDALERRGVTVQGTPTTGRAPADALPLAVDYSDLLIEVVRHMNRESDNFVSEMLLKGIGATVAGRGTTAAGAHVVHTELVAAGVSVSGVRIADGSGLSRRDRLTADALVGVLRAGADDPAIRGAFVTSLSVAGISGTLARRLERRPTRGQVIGKTGTTNVACALAGFVRKRYVFAIVQNGSPVPYWTARAAQDRFVTVLARS
jgi:D-alanyl-D-alanine carboxypeptidase/D-alanyl-D-alanine-endopeptidase (penicillin-binding protein 4)